MTQSDPLKKYEKIAKKLLRAHMGKYVENVSIHAGTDHLDDESLFVEASLDESAPIDLGWEFIISQHSLKEALQAEGENRFPYLSTKRRDNKQPTDITIKSEFGIMTKRKSAQKAQAK